MLKGFWIHYDEDIKMAHFRTLKTCYNLILKWMHEDLSPPKSLNMLAKTVSNSTLKELLSETELNVLMLNSVKFQLPVLACIIPYVLSRWNLMKGGSDINTKFIGFFKYTCLYLSVKQRSHQGK